MSQVNTKSVAGFTASVTLSRTAVAMVALLAIALSARTLGPDGRGKLVALIQVTYFVFLLAFGGVQSYLLQLTRVKERDEVIALMKLFDYWASAVAAIGVPAVSIIAALLAGTDAGMWCLLAGALTYSEIRLGVVTTTCTLTGDSSPIVRLTAISSLLMAAGFVVLATSNVQLWQVWILPYIVPNLTLASYFSRRLSIGTARATLETSFFRGSASATLIPLGQLLVFRGDRLLLALVATDKDLGVYATLAVGSEFVAMVGRVYFEAATPRWSAERRQDLTHGLFRRMAQAFSIVGVIPAAAYFLLGPLLTEYALGSAFSDYKNLSRDFAFVALAQVLVLGVHSVALASGGLQKVASLWLVSGLIAQPIYLIAISLGSLRILAVTSACLYLGIAAVSAAIVSRGASQ
jgi:O-antigen/teichoic acid export membrane protein